MIVPYKPYIPQNVGEILDHVRSMMLGSPDFKDDTGYLPGRNIDTAFFALNEGLRIHRGTLGDDRYTMLRTRSDQMRSLFESDPDDMNGGTTAGRKLIREMEDILKSGARQRGAE
jgi:hypothetical protein